MVSRDLPFETINFRCLTVFNSSLFLLSLKILYNILALLFQRFFLLELIRCVFV